MSIDGQSLAGVKNRVTKSQLTEELYRIERQQKAEMRMHNTTKQRFRTKYSKLDLYIDRGKDAANVVLYETHTPGFCYRRNGECRIPQAPSPSHSVDFQDIHSLLFTEGEVDIEKVLCLHLLTAHKTETLTPPSKYHKAISFLAKEQSPLERLIERSRKKQQEDVVTKLLPTYVLDVKTKKSVDDVSSNDSKVVIRDGRLAARVIINDKIVQLVHTVMAALEDTNPDKMNELLTMAKDPSIIQQVVEKPHIQEFLSTLNGQMLISSCESFHLTQPFKTKTIALELETKSVGLERLVSQIRKNVLQSPNQSTWKDMYNKSRLRSEDESVGKISEAKKNPKRDAISITSKTSTNSEKDDTSSTRKDFINKNKENAGKIIKNNPPSSKTSKFSGIRYPINKTNNSRDLTSKRRDQDYRSNDIFESEFINSMLSQDLKANSERVAKSVATNDDNNSSMDEVVVNNIEFSKGMDIKRVPRMISKKTSPSRKPELEALEEVTEDDDEVVEKITDLKSSSKTREKSVIQKAKVKPKASKTRKISETNSDLSANKLLDANERKQKLSQIIEAEMKRLKAEEIKSLRVHRNSNIPVSKIYRPTARGNFIKRQSIDNVELDILDLARISQEIKEKETQKKLNKFLENKIE